MRPPLALRRLLPPALALVLLAAGCGGAGVSVQGTVTGPTPTYGDGDTFNVVFVPTDGRGKAVSGEVKADKTFTLAGGDGRGVTPGAYKVVLSVEPYPGPNAEQAFKAVQPFNTQFDEKNTPLKYEVTGDRTQTVTIDLDAKAVRK